MPKKKVKKKVKVTKKKKATRKKVTKKKVVEKRKEAGAARKLLNRDELEALRQKLQKKYH